MRTLAHTGVSLALAGLLAACGSSVKLDEPPVESRTLSPVPSAPTQAAVTSGQAAAAGQPATPAAPAPAAQSQVTTVQAGQMGGKGVDGLPPGVGRIVFFDFDSFVVRDDGRAVVEAHARLLNANRARKMIVEGHTDERGGREYNLALGQKRAEAVVRSLTLLGGAESQLEAVSFGEERPAVQGSDEAAWAKNRRAELKDRS
ncbi:MAG: peptidoglycan-associated lipoprotein Pal [Betaproteobacteria bacterium]|jgi:peptidoglycan-associated lipoprotein